MSAALMERADLTADGLMDRAAEMWTTAMPADNDWWLRRFAKLDAIDDDLERVARATNEIDDLEKLRALCSAIRDVAVYDIYKSGGANKDIAEGTGLTPSRISQFIARVSKPGARQHAATRLTEGRRLVRRLK
jgi:hypothetical protein